MKAPTVRHRWPYALAAVAALAVAGWYVSKTLATAGGMGFPLDDAYIYMTYAKQAARGRPFTYFDGGGYSSGATSVLWPMLTAPLWAVGLRGHLFISAVFACCVALLATTSVLVVALARRIFGPWTGLASGLVAATLIVGSGTLTWGYLSGMEVALAGTFLLGSALSLWADGDPVRPSRRTLLLLAGAAMARPEISLLVAALVGLRALGRLLGRDVPGAARWLTPLVPVILVALLNRAFTGHFTPNTALVKSQVYLPGFTLHSWKEIFIGEGGKLAGALFWGTEKARGPTWAPQLTLVAYVVGALRLVWEGRRAGRLTAAIFLAVTPITLFAVVIGLAGVWRFHNYRYVATALPPLLLVCALAVAPPRRLPPIAAVVLGFLMAGAAGYGTFTLLKRDVWSFAQQTNDLNKQLVPVAEYMRDQLPPGALVAVHDVGIFGYYGGHPLKDMAGLVTHGTAAVSNNGPGSRFEYLEALPPAERPPYFTYYPGWLLTGARDLFGKVLLASYVPAAVLGAPRLIGGSSMQVMEANWELLGSGAAPFDAGGWRVVDEVDVADLASERAHGYWADQGERRFDTRTSTWSVYYLAEHDGRRVAEGGRTVRLPGGERFTVVADPAKPLRLVVRSGGPRGLTSSDLPPTAHPLAIALEDGRPLGEVILPAPANDFFDVALELPADPTRPRELHLRVTSPGGGPYRVFHWFALQP